MTNEEKLKLIESRITDARINVAMLEQERQEISIQIFESKSKFKKGATVKLKGKTGEIVRYEVSYNSVYPVVRFFNKDGSIGKRESRMYRTDFETTEII